MTPTTPSRPSPTPAAPVGRIIDPAGGWRPGHAVDPRDRGAVAVEMALVTPLLLLMLFGIIDFGRMLNAQITLTEAAREGARAVALGYPADEEVAAAVTGLRPAPETRVVSGCGDASEPESADPGPDDAIVSVSHSFRAVTPLGALTRIFGGTEDGSLTITARGVMPCLGSG